MNTAGVLLEKPEMLYIYLPLTLIISLLMSFIGSRKISGKLHKAVNPLVSFIKYGERRKTNIITEELSIAFLALLFISLSNPHIVEERKIISERESMGSLEFSVKPPILLVIDVSGSMGGEKIEKAKEALKTFIHEINGSMDIGLIAFDQVVEVSIPPINDTQQLIKAIDSLEAMGGTMYQYPLNTAYQWLKPYRDFNISTSIVFASDGLPADADALPGIIEKYRKSNITIYAVFIGYENEGYELLKDMAVKTGGEAYKVEEIDKLVDTYRSLAEDIVNKTLTNIRISMKYESTVYVKHSLSNIFYAVALLDLAFIYLLRNRWIGVSL